MIRKEICAGFLAGKTESQSKRRPGTEEERTLKEEMKGLRKLSQSVQLSDFPGVVV